MHITGVCPDCAELHDDDAIIEKVRSSVGGKRLAVGTA
jgi:hypothetical protein